MSVYDKDLAWDYVNDIKAICKPLFDKLNISYFDYARFYPDNTVFGLFTDADYVDFFRNHEAYQNGPKAILTPGKHLWSTYIDGQFLHEASHYHRHAHGLTLINELPDYVEVCNFATSPDNIKIVELYLNGTDYLYRFLGHFKEQAAKIIKRCEQHRITLPAFEPPEPSNYLERAERFLQELSLDKVYWVERNGQTHKLTQREAECLSAVLSGKTYKLTGLELDISPRTVETHIEKIKNKLDCYSKSDLINAVTKQSIVLNWEY